MLRHRLLLSFVILITVTALVSTLSAQSPRTWSPQKPDDRLKADLLLLVAHPDDDTLAGPYLARAIGEEKRRVAVIFMTSGDSGGNQAGAERGHVAGPDPANGGAARSRDPRDHERLVSGRA